MSKRTKLEDGSSSTHDAVTLEEIAQKLFAAPLYSGKDTFSGKDEISDDMFYQINAWKRLEEVPEPEDWSIQSYTEYMDSLMDADDAVAKFRACDRPVEEQQKRLHCYLAYQYLKYDEPTAMKFNNCDCNVNDHFVLAIVLLEDSVAAKNFGLLLDDLDIKRTLFDLREKFESNYELHQSVRDALYNYCTCKREDEINFLNANVRHVSDRW